MGWPRLYRIYAMTDLALCNAALAELGEARIGDLTANEFVPGLCAQMLPLARREVLRMHRWNFAQQRAALSQLESTPIFGKAYAFALPMACVRVLEVNGVSGAGDPGEEWELEGGVLLSDASSVQLVLISDEVDLGKWDSLALDCLRLRLAAKMAPSIQGGSTSKADRLMEELRRIIEPLAKRVDANEARRGADNLMVQMMSGSRALRARGGDA